MSKVIIQEVGEGIALLTMNRPEARNALDWEAMQLFADTVEELREREDLRALVVQGRDGAFCAGGDLFELHHYQSRLDGVRLGQIMGEALDKLSGMPCPVIAAIEGAAMGGGAEIALACDIRIMASDAVLGLMHVRLAITPAWGGGLRLLNLAGYAQALDWLAAGVVLSAEEAQRHGVANYVVEPGETWEKALNLAKVYADRDQASVRAIKTFLQAGSRLPYEQAVRVEREAFPDRWAAAPHIEASTEFVNRKNHKPKGEPQSTS